jgi:hypothetical protein
LWHSEPAREATSGHERPSELRGAEASANWQLPTVPLHAVRTRECQADRPSLLRTLRCSRPRGHPITATSALDLFTPCQSSFRNELRLRPGDVIGVGEDGPERVCAYAIGECGDSSMRLFGGPVPPSPRRPYSMVKSNRTVLTDSEINAVRGSDDTVDLRPESRFHQIAAERSPKSPSPDSVGQQAQDLEPASASPSHVSRRATPRCSLSHSSHPTPPRRTIGRPLAW